MSENMVHNLYKFIKEGVTDDQMFAATEEAYKEKTEEGKLPADIANIQKPDQYVQDLKEEEKKEDKEGKDKAENPEIKTDNAGVTPEPEKTDVSKDLEKETPAVDKLVQDKDGKDPLVEPDKVKEEKKEEVKVEGVEKVKAENEGKLPADIANIQKPADYVQDLKEETEKVIAAEISDESVARDLASKNNAEAVQNPQTKLWKVISKAAAPSTGSYVATAPAVESKTDEKKACTCGKEGCECVKEEKVTECPTVDAAKGDKLEKQKKVKEDVDVTIKTDDKEVNVVSADGSTQVTTLDTGTPAPVSTVTEPPITTETPISEPEPELEEPELSDEEALEMAEKLMVVEHLETMDEKKMSAKQKKFIEDVKSKKFSKKNKDKIENKKKEIK